MQLDCYKVHDIAPEIVPGTYSREWMDAFPDRHPYRCLPLTMANTTGWEILSPMDVMIEWDGGMTESAIKFYTRGESLPVKHFVDSHFRRGIVTFHTGYLFRTPPGWGIWATAPPNMAKDGISPLTGLIETDWLPFPFTMNWQMTRPGKVTFKKGEPFCFITLMEHGKLEEIEPKIHKLKDHAELHGDFEAWSSSRSDFNARLAAREEGATKAGWQRHYMRGEKVDGDGSKEESHVSKRRLKKPVEG